MKELKSGEFVSNFFSLFEIADGVYAAIRKEASEAGSNAGIVDLGDYSVIFDSFLNIDAADDLRKACIKLTGKDARFVVNSHGHWDHVVGNQVFSSQTSIVSSIKVREQEAVYKKELEDGNVFNSNTLAELEERLKTETDETKILDLKNDIVFIKNLSRPGNKLRMPDLTFDREMVLYGSKRNLHLYTADIAHSPGDVYAFLPDDKICFAGDLLFCNSHPWLGSGDPEKFVIELRKLLELGATHFVPGHGNVAGNDDILLEIQYIEEITRLVLDSLNHDGKQITIHDLSEAFWNWKGLCFAWNVDFLRGKLNTEKGENKE